MHVFKNGDKVHNKNSSSNMEGIYIGKIPGEAASAILKPPNLLVRWDDFSIVPAPLTNEEIAQKYTDILHKELAAACLDFEFVDIQGNILTAINEAIGNIPF